MDAIVVHSGGFTYDSKSAWDLLTEAKAQTDLKLQTSMLEKLERILKAVHEPTFERYENYVICSLALQYEASTSAWDRFMQAWLRSQLDAGSLIGAKLTILYRWSGAGKSSNWLIREPSAIARATRDAADAERALISTQIQAMSQVLLHVNPPTQTKQTWKAWVAYLRAVVAHHPSETPCYLCWLLTAMSDHKLWYGAVDGQPVAWPIENRDYHSDHRRLHHLAIENLRHLSTNKEAGTAVWFNTNNDRLWAIDQLATLNVKD